MGLENLSKVLKAQLISLCCPGYSVPGRIPGIREKIIEKWIVCPETGPINRLFSPRIGTRPGAGPSRPAVVCSQFLSFFFPTPKRAALQGHHHPILMEASQ